jgi:hypothetical protein
MANNGISSKLWSDTLQYFSYDLESQYALPMKENVQEYASV